MSRANYSKIEKININIFKNSALYNILFNTFYQPVFNTKIIIIILKLFFVN